jgi:hypothetical protein
VVFYMPGFPWSAPNLLMQRDSGDGNLLGALPLYPKKAGAGDRDSTRPCIRWVLGISSFTVAFYIPGLPWSASNLFDQFF